MNSTLYFKISSFNFNCRKVILNYFLVHHTQKKHSEITFVSNLYKEPVAIEIKNNRFSNPNKLV
jgi:hypothetical protein